MAAPGSVFWLGERSEYSTTDFDGRLRRCQVVGRLAHESADGREARKGSPGPTILWVRLDPALVLFGDRFDEVVLQARHVGRDLDHLGDGSISVYVFEIRSKAGFDRGLISLGALHLLAWADVAREPAFLPPTQEETFDRTFEVLQGYAEREGDSNLAQGNSAAGQPLGNWVRNMKRSQARGELRADWMDRLATLPGWRWGVNAERDWSFAADHGFLWLIAPEGTNRAEWDRRLRMCSPVGTGSPVEREDARSGQWMSVYPPLRIKSDAPGMLVITARQPDVDLPTDDSDPVAVDVAHIRSWQALPDGTRRPDEVLELGVAVVARDPALLPPMSGAEWRDGLAALRRYRMAIGHCWVPFDYVPAGDHDTVVHLGGWALRVRSEHRRGTLEAWRAALLEQVQGWQWSYPADG